MDNGAARRATVGVVLEDCSKAAAELEAMLHAIDHDVSGPKPKQDGTELLKEPSGPSMVGHALGLLASLRRATNLARSVQMDLGLVRDEPMARGARSG